MAISAGSIVQWDAAFNSATRARVAALDAIPPGPFMAIDAAAWRYRSGRPVIVTPSEGMGALGCMAAIYGVRSVVLESAHFRAFDTMYSGADRPIWLGPPVTRDAIKVYPVTGGLAGCSIGKLP